MEPRLLLDILPEPSTWVSDRRFLLLGGPRGHGPTLTLRSTVAEAL